MPRVLHRGVGGSIYMYMYMYVYMYIYIYMTKEFPVLQEHMPGGSIAELVARFGKLDERYIF